jgi:hypothetical protein
LRPASLSPTASPKPPWNRKSGARWAGRRIIIHLKNFEESFDNEHQVAMGFTGGEAGVLRIAGMGYFDPDFVKFFGSDPTGVKTQLVQHVTQMSVMLRALPKAVQAEAPKRIGFRLAQDLDER